MANRIGLIIPVFNVARTMGRVLHSLSGAVLEDIDQILVIDNNSSDNTLEELRPLLNSQTALGRKLRLFRHHENYGYGSSIMTGFDYYLKSGTDRVVIIHGDFQSDPAKLVRSLLDEVHRDPTIDVVLASRFMAESEISRYSLIRRVGNYFFNRFTRLATGLSMSDSGTAIICIKTDLLRKIPFSSLSRTWQFHPQLNILLYSHPSLRLKEIPMQWADSEAASQVKLISYGMTLSKILLSFWFEKNVLGKSADEIFGKQKSNSLRLYSSVIGSQSC